MPFAENISFMQGLYDEMPVRERHGNIHSLESQVPGLQLRYPGALRGRQIGDYCLYLNAFAPSHIHVVRAIYAYCERQGADGAEAILCFLEDLATNGLAGTVDLPAPFELEGHELDGRQTRVLLYWLILQEDINYPRERYMGVRMPLIRYTEAVIASTHPALLGIATVVARTEARGGRPAPRFEHRELPIRYQDTFGVIEHM
ncbi:hypothetical protein EVJ29_13410 [Exiguobacterium sp. SH4S7]|uniref:hypothetical protein n=1 Tax=Exiguobacterium sp. SH4S7 TaxID=2510958 RepID=UPI001038656E|nr:hypothetical protein [Exiguobacterium sp. SH4S7]TCI33880.1 hypothetical protein EVJ29_13410 [Exiguobacterium sp. SH4S7]